MRNGTRLLVSTLFAAALAAACGGGAPAPAAPSTPAPSASTSAPETPAPQAAAPTPSAGAPSAAPATATNVEIVPSKMIADVKAIGIDLEKAGDLSKIDLSKKKKLMPLFVKALGMSGCEGCHVAGDFKAKTQAKEMASQMWGHFVRDLRMKGGGALFCDSCHQGKEKILARGDKKALAAFMQSNYEDKLERANKKEHGCGTCHADPFEGKIFAKLWKVAPT